MNPEPEMKITAIAPWFGGKRTLAPRIVAELGQHSAYWEPFCGGLSIIMSKPPARMETVNDLHGDLINLARIVRHRELGPQLYRRARRILVSDEMIAEFDGLVRNDNWDSDELNFDRGLAFFVTSWMGRNGEVGLSKNERGRGLAVRWVPSGGDSVTRWNGAVDSIPAWRRRLRDVMILRRDAFELLAKIRDEPKTVIYCDPPYLVKSDKYLHDFGDGFMGDDDHQRLADELQRFKVARVIVSYYAHPRLKQLYPSWTVVNHKMNKAVAVVSGGAPKSAPEVLLINGPSFAEAK